MFSRSVYSRTLWQRWFLEHTTPALAHSAEARPHFRVPGTSSNEGFGGAAQRALVPRANGLALTPRFFSVTPGSDNASTSTSTASTSSRGHRDAHTAVYSKLNEYTDDDSNDLAPWEDSMHPRQRTAEHEHFKDVKSEAPDKNYMLDHPIWSDEEKNSIEIQHRKCVTLSDYAAFAAVRTLRFNFDLFSGYYFGNMDESKWLTRIVFLETVAGVPGMVGAMIRHLHSLRLMRRDYGWIHTLLEEAENERMHLLTAMTLKKPTKLFRAAVLFGQGIFVNFWFLAYLVSPRFCHRFVGYLEEEAVVTYTKCLQQLDNKQLPLFSKLEAPKIAIKYWRLPKDAMMRDVLMSVRADEGHHRDVNHALADRDAYTPNPFGKGQ